MINFLLKKLLMLLGVILASFAFDAAPSAASTSAVLEVPSAGNISAVQTTGQPPASSSFPLDCNGMGRFCFPWIPLHRNSLGCTGRHLWWRSPRGRCCHR